MIADGDVNESGIPHRRSLRSPAWSRARTSPSILRWRNGAPEVRRGKSFYPNQRLRDRGEQTQHPSPSQLFATNHLAISISALNLEHGLGEIDPDPDHDRLHGGRLLLVLAVSASIRLRRIGAEHKGRPAPKASANQCRVEAAL